MLFLGAGTVFALLAHGVEFDLLLRREEGIDLGFGGFADLLAFFALILRFTGLIVEGLQLLALISEAYRGSPAASGVLRTARTR